MIQILSYIIATGAINPVYGNIVFSIVVILARQLMSKNKLTIYGLKCTSAGILLAFCALYWVIGECTLRAFEYYLLLPILCYLSGWAICDCYRGRKHGAIKVFIYSSLIGYGTHAVLILHER